MIFSYFKGDFVIGREKHKKMSETDKHLKRFDYRAALDCALKQQRRNPPMVLSVIVELARRDGLKIALSNRGAEEIVQILDFIVR